LIVQHHNDNLKTGIFCCLVCKSSESGFIRITQTDKNLYGDSGMAIWGLERKRANDDFNLLASKIIDREGQIVCVSSKSDIRSADSDGLLAMDTSSQERKIVSSFCSIEMAEWALVLNETDRKQLTPCLTISQPITHFVVICIHLNSKCDNLRLRFSP
jgi:hypothetical protein